jgi:beta-lactamase class D
VVLPWDGRRNDLSSWNRDQDLASAMRTSANWFFEALLRRLPARAIEGAVASVGYGNGETAGDPLHFWVGGALRISALEQVAIMSRLAAGALPFTRRSQDIVAGVSIIERRGSAVLHGKTGTSVDGGQMVSWIVGFVEDGGPTFAYATLMRGPASNLDRVLGRRLAITRVLLARQGALPAP